jgi:16S rRNA (guanine966-N2)-methyltransferase
MTRIIAGTHRGRRLATPNHSQTRPTSDRVREAVFSAMADFFGQGGADTSSALAGLSFCDLYAGSGAVGLEAASRGASPVLLVEKDRRTADIARRNVAALGVEAEVRAAPVERVLDDRSQPFDIVWLDPPYDVPTATVDAVLARLAGRGWLGENSLAVVERSTRSDAVSWPTELSDRWSRRYGETTVYFACEEA